jgi:hypothetical protein
MNILEGNAVIKFLLFLIGEMAEAIPLRGDLGVKGPDVVVYNTGVLVDDFLVEKGAVEEGSVRGGLSRERPVE